MTSTSFIDNVTVVYSSWLNDINNFFYSTCSGASTAAQLRTNIGAISKTGDTATGAYTITGGVTATTLAATANATVGGTLGVTGTTTLGTVNATTGNVSTNNVAQLNATNATFTNSPTVPTATLGDNTTKAASTAFVQAIAFGSGGIPVSQISNVWLTQEATFTLTTSNGNTFFDTTKKDFLGEITRPGGLPTFTATYSGTYLVTFSYSTTATTASSLSGDIYLFTTGVLVQKQGFAGYTDNSGASVAVKGSLTVVLTAGQTMQIYPTLTSGTIGMSRNTTVSSNYINNTYATIVRIA